jgi:hypothetical protein
VIVKAAARTVVIMVVIFRWMALVEGAVIWTPQPARRTE